MSPVTQCVRLITTGQAIEIEGYLADATVGDLVAEIERYRLTQTQLKTSRCAGCGSCCNQQPPVFAQDIEALTRAHGIRDDAPGVLDGILIYPSAPDMDARERGIRDIMRHMGMDRTQAALTYEYNQSEPIVIGSHADGSCHYLEAGRCSIYEHRPLTCRLYLCNMGERLSLLQERVTTEGTWHMYARLGWTRNTDLPHNAFYGAAQQMDLPLRLFERTSDQPDTERLFFFF